MITSLQSLILSRVCACEVRTKLTFYPQPHGSQNGMHYTFTTWIRNTGMVSSIAAHSGERVENFKYFGILLFHHRPHCAGGPI